MKLEPIKGGWSMTIESRSEAKVLYEAHQSNSVSERAMFKDDPGYSREHIALEVGYILRFAEQVLPETPVEGSTVVPMDHDASQYVSNLIHNVQVVADETCRPVTDNDELIGELSAQLDRFFTTGE